MSGDQRVGIAEPGAPSAYIDNHATTNDSNQAVLQQKIRAPMVETLLSALINLIGPLGLAANGTGGALRAVLQTGSTTAVTGSLTSAGTVSTVTTVTTVATVTNLAQVGGVSAAFDQYNSSALVAQGLRSRIVVT